VTASCARSRIDVASLNALRDVEQAAKGATRPSPSSGSPWARFQGQPWFRAVSSGHICVRWFQGVIPRQWRRGSPARRGLALVLAVLDARRGRAFEHCWSLWEAVGGGSPWRWDGFQANSLAAARAGARATCIFGSVGRGSDVLRWAGAVRRRIRWPSLAVVSLSPCRRGGGGPIVPRRRRASRFE
jgi:hypothetical protein